MYKKKEEAVDHLISACSKIAHTDYLDRHNRVASMICWNLCKSTFLAAKKWWEHKAEKVFQKDDVNVLWDFKIQTDKHLAHSKPDITEVAKKQVWLVDVTIPRDI